VSRAPYQVSRLQSGLLVASAHMPHMSSVCVGVWVRIGSRYEPAELNGIYHFIEHMLFKGTRRRSAREITQAVEGIGGSLDAFTGEESSCIYSRSHTEHFEHVLEVMMDMLLHSKFEPADIEKERSIIKEELAMYLDQPQHVVDDLICETLWPNHALGRPLTGTPETIDRFVRSVVVGSYKTGYLASNCVIAAAGRITHAAVLKAARRYERLFSNGKQPAFVPTDRQQAVPRVRIARRKVAQAQIAFGIRTCCRHDERRYALRLLNVILGENMSSRLFQIVREEHGLAYNVHSCLNWFDDTGSFVIYAGVDPQDVEGTVRLIVNELRRIAMRPPGGAEFRAGRDYVLGQLDIGLEGTENQMMWLGEHLVDYGRVISPAVVKRRLSEVTPAAVQKVARDYFRPEHANLAVIGPRNNARPLERILGGL
jgi:predicted Zn-dependent peptidase